MVVKTEQIKHLITLLYSKCINTIKYINIHSLTLLDLYTINDGGVPFCHFFFLCALCEFVCTFNSELQLNFKLQGRCVFFFFRCCLFWKKSRGYFELSSKYSVQLTFIIVMDIKCIVLNCGQEFIFWQMFLLAQMSNVLRYKLFFFLFWLFAEIPNFPIKIKINKFFLQSQTFIYHTILYMDYLVSILSIFKNVFKTNGEDFWMEDEQFLNIKPCESIAY